MRPFVRTPLFAALVFLAVLALVLMYSTLFALRGLDVKSCQRQIPVRVAAKQFYRLDADFQRHLALAGNRGEGRLRESVATDWDILADELTVPKCDSDEIGYPFPF